MAAVLTLAGGCRGDGGGEGGAAFGPSVERIVNSEGAWKAGTGWSLVEDLRIGAASGNGPEVWGGVVDVAVDAAGRLYVLDNLAHEIRVFDAAGRYIRTFSREGRGPGELDVSAALFFSPFGNLWVHDARNQRFTVFDTAGSYLREHPIR
ncbi:MAG TPA: 6-bladed beta-propeller, partial [Longimicrobiales bacterium]|nr:6-bladed beta-propeller [Longimicrobiales bacterium]